MVKVELKEKAVSLRKRGYSYSLIKKYVPVSKSTLTEWLKNIPYTENQEVVNRIRGARFGVVDWQKRNK